MKDLIWVEVSKKSILNNYFLIKNLTSKNVTIAPCVKSNAYGHGIVEFSKELIKLGIDWLCVNSIDEALKIRKLRKNISIIILGYIDNEDYKTVINEGFKPVFYSIKPLINFALLCKKLDKKIGIHLMFDTGMKREGFELNRFVKTFNRISHLHNIVVEGIATHFSTADEKNENKRFINQIKNLKKIIHLVNNQDIMFHCANSATTIMYPQLQLNLVRPGIIMYGYHGNEYFKKYCQNNKLNFQPALTLKTKIIQIKNIQPKTNIGYGYSFKSNKKMKIALLPIGYHDGLPRSLSNKGYVIINGQKAMIVGNINMSMSTVDITAIRNVKIGNEVIIYGKINGLNSLEDNALLSGTIVNEILTGIRESISRFYVK